jgi:dihydrofolate synthase / folylpolyglutamate synthase
VLQLNQFGFPVKEDRIRKALATASFPGRFEVINYTLPARNAARSAAGGDAKRYTLILDGAHNPAKMRAFLTSLRTLYPEHTKAFLITFKKGKQIEEMIRMIVGEADTLTVTEFHRTIDYHKNASIYAETLKDIVLPITAEQKISLYSAGTAGVGLQTALRSVNHAEKALVIVTGSLYLVGEVRELIQEE